MQTIGTTTAAMDGVSLLPIPIKKEKDNDYSH
jgi:hypothetical protein